jgi:hypothetical protein
MKKEGRVVQVAGNVVTVAVAGNGDASQPVAPCCTVPSVLVEAKNLLGMEIHTGELVEVTDGLGTMAFGASSFLLFPAVLYGFGAALSASSWIGILGTALGILLAVLFFKGLNIGQYPKLLRRIGPAAEDNPEKES